LNLGDSIGAACDDAGHDNGPPNNWLSRFGGSAWQWDDTTRQYYYHAFLPELLDLNWRNVEVRQAMGDVMRFWLRRGVDGFRVDASAVLAEDTLLRDDPPDPDTDEHKPPPQCLNHVFSDDRPEAMAYIENVRAVLGELPDRVLAGEVQDKNWELRSPTNFGTATRFIRPEDMKESAPISHDLSRRAKWLREYIDLAFEELHLHQMGTRSAIAESG
jgi:glycosidase